MLGTHWFSEFHSIYFGGKFYYMYSIAVDNEGRGCLATFDFLGVIIQVVRRKLFLDVNIWFLAMICGWLELRNQ